MRRDSEALLAPQGRYAALYIRVSTTDQGERFSPASQRKALLDKAAREGFAVRPEHIFEDQQTGKNDNRPAFIRLRALVKTGAIQAVFVFSVDRFARKTVDALQVSAEFKRHGVRLDFVETPFEDTSMGRFTFTQMSAVAELMGEKIVEDSRRGRRQALEQGRITQTTPKYGYDYIPKREKNGSRFVINETEAPVVREIYRWCLAGMTTCQIAAKLNAEGVLSKGSPGKPAGLWGRQSVFKVLRSKTYTGSYTVWGIEIPIDPIIDMPTWLAVQDKLKANGQKYVGRPSVEALLRGLMFCGECGRRVCYKSKWSGSGRDAAYRCGNIVTRTAKRVCHASSVLAHVIEEKAWSALWNLLKQPELLMRLGEAYHEAIATPDSDRLQTLERELSQLRNKERTIIDMCKNAMITLDEARKDQKLIRERIAQISEELRSAKRVVSLPTLSAARATLREITDGPEPQTFAGRRPILDSIIDLRMVYLAGDLEITGQVPVPDAAAMKSTGSRGGNCSHGINGGGNLTLCIPFTLKVKVA